MDIDALLAFVTIVNEKSFSRAADSLHLTQPAISKRIQNLEQRLDVKLFERLQREIRLTDAGEVLLPHAQSILHAFNNAQQAIRDMGRHVAGSLRIVASHHIGLHRLPRILEQYSRTYPQVDLQLNFLDSESAYELLKDNVADLAFITIPQEVREEFTSHLVWDDPMSFICAPNHPLAHLKQIRPKDLAAHNAILPSQTTLTYRVVETIFRDSGLALKANIPTNYLETMKMMAAVGMGWSVLPNTMIDDSLVVLPVSKPKVARRLGALSYHKKQLSQAALRFLECAEAVWGKL
ncbi:MAG: LysR family transcriptional regulator [Oleiphilaceae bacterium]|nr:LysR family transcriptional regulator [Oleiphilaceae bacterium]